MLQYYLMISNITVTIIMKIQLYFVISFKIYRKIPFFTPQPHSPKRPIVFPEAPGSGDHTNALKNQEIIAEPL